MEKSWKQGKADDSTNQIDRLGMFTSDMGQSKDASIEKREDTFANTEIPQDPSPVLEAGIIWDRRGATIHLQSSGNHRIQ